MGFFSKVWKGVKKHVKRIARGAKKVAKKMTHALPGGKELWKAGTKVGQGVMKGIGKITNALGPVGMFALNFVLPGIGAFASALFSAIPGFAALSSFAGEIVGKLGAQAVKVFGGDSFVNQTIGKLGEAITTGVGKMVPESVKGIAKDLVTGFKANFPNVSEKLTQVGDKIFATGPTASEKILTQATESATAQAAELFGETNLGSFVPKEALTESFIEESVKTQLANPGVIDQIRLLGEETGITKAVKVGQNIKGLAEQAGIGGADASAPVQQQAGPAVIAPAPTVRQAPAGRAPDALRAVGSNGSNGSSGANFFDNLVQQAQQSRGGFA